MRSALTAQSHIVGSENGLFWNSVLFHESDENEMRGDVAGLDHDVR